MPCNSTAESINAPVDAESYARVLSAEADLVVRARAGDTSAFENLMKLHEQQVLRTAGRVLRQQEDARDAAQEVFLKLYRNLGRIREEADLRPWLYRVTINVCRDLGRKRGLFPKTAPDWETTGIPFEPGSTVDDELDLEKRRRLVQAALERLPEKERMALVLRDIEGLSTEQTAQVLESSSTTIRSQVASARIKIRKFCERATRGLR